ncbi:MAG TPA: HdeD family acid-resistance protein [Methanoregula sp.]|nr:HdeD family acid-resistance protein [Methanoregula sp.]
MMTETPVTPETKGSSCVCSCECIAPGLFPWWVLLLWGILALIVGIMFLASPGITIVIFITFLGAYWLVGGIFSLASLAVDRKDWGWKILLAILNLIAGIVILAYPLISTVLLLSFLIILVGVWACITGGVHLYQAFSRKDAGNGILGILSLIFGILLLIFPLISAALLPYIAGIFAIVIGFAAIVASFAAKKAEQVAPAAP